MSGNYAVIGAPFCNDSVGAAYVFRLEGSYWIEKQKLIASDGKAGDSFGTTVSIYDDYLIIGSPYSDSLKGSAYIFRKEGSNWIEEQKLSRSDIYRWFGTAVSISGDYIIVGASYIIGAAYIYKREGNTWLEKQKLVPSGEDTLFNYFGISVSISGDYAVVGSPGSISNGIYPGAAYVFKQDGINWTEEQKLVTSDGANRDFFGLSVSISSGYIVVGAPWDGDAGAMSGSAYIFSKSGSNWIEKQKLTANDGNSADIFGVSVSITENKAIIGAPGNDDNGQNSGSAYLYNNFVVGVENDEGENPLSYSLDQNYPNPFNPSTTIRYSVPQSSNVVIKIYDILGNEIETLVNEEKVVGTYEIKWYAENISSGIYFYRLQGGEFIETKKMILIK
jgi:hypothetical protein